MGLGSARGIQLFVLSFNALSIFTKDSHINTTNERRIDAIRRFMMARKQDAGLQWQGSEPTHQKQERYKQAIHTLLEGLAIEGMQFNPVVGSLGCCLDLPIHETTYPERVCKYTGQSILGGWLFPNAIQDGLVAIGIEDATVFASNPCTISEHTMKRLADKMESTPEADIHALRTTFSTAFHHSVETFKTSTLGQRRHPWTHSITERSTNKSPLSP
jgi:hypothetical protein